MNSMYRRMQVLFALAVVVGLFVSMYGSAAAQVSSPGTQSSPVRVVEDKAAQYAKMEQAVRLLEQHISVGSDGLLVLKADAIQLSIEPAVFEQLKASLEQTNALIRAGTVRASDVKLRMDAVKHADVAPNGVTTLACGGVNKTVNRWYSKDVYMDSCNTSQMVYFIQTKATLATVCAFYKPWGYPCALLAILFNQQANKIASYNQGSGVRAVYLWGPPSDGGYALWYMESQ